MKYGSVCSGIDAATLAWKPLGWDAEFYSEIEPFPASVLAARWPQTPNLGDFTKINGKTYRGKIDLLTGGTPCQSFSIAGKRTGLTDRRGNLACEFARLAFETGVRWLLWENVPGVLSSNQGKDFAWLLSLLCGWEIEVPIVDKKGTRRWKNSGVITPAPGGFGLAWRVLDAQYTRVAGYPRAIPQRRRRLFVIGYIGSWERAAKVLFDRDCLQRNTAPVRQAGTGIARSLTASTGGASGKEQQQTFIDGNGNPLNALQKSYGIAENIIGRLPQNGGNGSGINEDVQFTLNTIGTHGVCCFTKNDAGNDWANNLAPTLRSGGESGGSIIPAISAKHTVRKLTPVECERLMGFPDDHTRISWKGKPAADCPDGPRYKTCGNSQCVNVMRWLGMRIEMVDKIK